MAQAGGSNRVESAIPERAFLATWHSVEGLASVDLYLMSPPTLAFRLRGRANFRSAKAGPVSGVAALAEWLAVADAIEAGGGRICCLLPAGDLDLTGLPYAAEAGHVVDHNGQLSFLLPNMASAHRQLERHEWRVVATALGFRPVDVPGGIWEAQGDVAEFRGQTLLTFGGRTDLAGVDAVSRWFPEDALRIAIRQPAFHGNMALLPLEAVDKLVVCPEALDGDALVKLVNAFGREDIIPVDLNDIRLYVTNALAIGRNLIAPHLAADRLGELASTLGYNLIVVPMLDLCEKGGGGPRCLVNHTRLEEARVCVPRELDFQARREEIVADLFR